MARTTDPLAETGEASEAAMHDAVAPVVANWRNHHHALRTFHETTIASAWFGMLEAQCYELFRRTPTRAEGTDLVATLTTLWLRALAAS
jgi:hypothetical protein